MNRNGSAMQTRTAMQGLFVITGIALVIAGLNNGLPLVIVGAALIVLALVSRAFGNKSA